MRNLKSKINISPVEPTFVSFTKSLGSKLNNYAENLASNIYTSRSAGLKSQNYRKQPTHKNDMSPVEPSIIYGFAEFHGLGGPDHGTKQHVTG